MNIHPYSLTFPEATPEEFQALKASMNQHGQREPIVILGGEILDGRTRYRAATELKIPPVFRQYCPVKDGPDPLAWVIDRNLHRRHLTVGQRAALAITLEKMILEAREAAKAKQAPPANVTPTGPTLVPDEDDDAVATPPTPEGDRMTARDEAAKAVGISTGSMAAAKELATKDPARFESVASGQTSLAAAAKASKADRESEQPSLLDGKPTIISQYRSECADLMAAGLGDKFADAVRASTILKDGELREFMKLTASDQKQISKLVSTGWKVKQAVKFAKGIFDQDDALRELINLATMRGGVAAIKIAGFRVLAASDEYLGRTEWITTRSLIAKVQTDQHKPDQADHQPVDNTLAAAFKQAEAKKWQPGDPAPESPPAPAKTPSMQKAEAALAKAAKQAKNPALHGTLAKIAKKNAKK